MEILTREEAIDHLEELDDYDFDDMSNEDLRKEIIDTGLSLDLFWNITTPEGFTVTGD